MPRVFNQKPIIGILLDEDTTNGGRYYTTNKGYFRAIEAAGAVAIGLPYAQDSVDFAVQNCAGLLATGGRIRFDDDFYIEGEKSTSPVSERLEIEKALIRNFLDNDMPFLGICNGMQVLAALSGGKLTYQIAVHSDKTSAPAIAHDNAETRHKIIIATGTKLHKIMASEAIITNSHHSEGVLRAPENLVISAKSEDNVIEAIERSDKSFAIGVQWHPEIMWPKPFNDRDIEIGQSSKKLFEAFVNAAKSKL